MSYLQKVQVATLRGVDHLLLVEGDLEVLLDEHAATRDEVQVRELFLSPWADDVIQHGLRAIVAPAAPVAVDPESFAETRLTLTGNKPWHHDLDAVLELKINSLLDGDISLGMDYGYATTVAFKSAMVVSQKMRDIMVIVAIGKAVYPVVFVTSWHDPYSNDCDRFFDTIEEAQDVFEIQIHQLKTIIAVDALVQMVFDVFEKQWPAIEI